MKNYSAKIEEKENSTTFEENVIRLLTELNITVSKCVVAINKLIELENKTFHIPKIKTIMKSK